ncbi:MAG TPA: hypothetical protein VLA71_00920 [Algoriphagus sp.]|nr:hypothetical protein [Algoriphagus sp.]
MINFLIVIVILHLTCCQKRRGEDCLTIPNPVEIKFEDATLKSICFSPLEEGKVWLRFGNNKNNDVVEVDASTGQKAILDKKYSQFFYSENDNGYIRYCHKDQFDSLVWIGGPNKNVVYYDQRTKIVQELPVLYVTRIISKPDEVFFVSRQGFCYWDRKTKTIEQVSGLPAEFMQSSELINDSVIILDGKYTYYFNSKKVKTGIFFNDYEHKGAWYSFKATEGLGLFYAKDSLWYNYNGHVAKLPLPNKHIDYTKISDQKYWQSDKDFYYSFDPKSKTINKYEYHLPPVNNHSVDYQIDSRHIWIIRPGQVMLIDLVTKKQLDYPIALEEEHIRTIIDECNTYTLYKNKIVIASKNDFIKKCLPYEFKQYKFNLKQFNDVVDSIGILKDTLPDVALKKLIYLKNKYSDVDHIQIKQRLQALNFQAFQSVTWRFPDGYIACYEDHDMPIEQRKACFISLVDQYGRLSDFKKVLQLTHEFEKEFGSPYSEDYYFASVVDSTRRYVDKIDSLKSLDLSEDSLYFYNALALETICRTHWYCHEGCGGCDFSLVINKLKRFSEKFPQSSLCDNAELYLLDANYMYDYDEDESLLAQNKEYEEFIKKHPDSDLNANIRFQIFQNLASMQVLDKREINSSARRFIREFPSDSRVENVKQRMNDLNNK